MAEMTRYIIDDANLPVDFPTHLHTAIFWESLGRTVATFGLLEEILCKAVFSFTAKRPYDDGEICDAYEQWLPKLQRMLSDPLAGLIDTYENSIKKHPNATFCSLPELLNDLKAAARVRNVLCHGSWRCPNDIGASIPFFVTKLNERFETLIDNAWLEQTRLHVVTLICAVINTVTQMGWQFPGSAGPGLPIWRNSDP